MWDNFVVPAETGGKIKRKSALHFPAGRTLSLRRVTSDPIGPLPSSRLSPDSAAKRRSVARRLISKTTSIRRSAEAVAPAPAPATTPTYIYISDSSDANKGSNLSLRSSDYSDTQDDDSFRLRTPSPPTRRSRHLTASSDDSSLHESDAVSDVISARDANENESMTDDDDHRSFLRCTDKRYRNSLATSHPPEMPQRKKERGLIWKIWSKTGTSTDDDLSASSSEIKPDATTHNKSEARKSKFKFRFFETKEKLPGSTEPPTHG